jgi:hypothetical protein
MADNTYIKFSKKRLYEDIRRCSSDTTRVFIYCLLQVRHEPTKEIIENEMINLVPGQFITDVMKMIDDLNMAHDRVESCIKALVQSGRISVFASRSYFVITVNDWDKYIQE